MSAIFGIIKKNNSPIEQGRLIKLQEAMAHRATDGKGLWQTEHAALGFGKLLAHPQQTNEVLPIEAGDLALTADAHLHNRDELYSLLNLNKKQWLKEPDSSLVLKAYQEWGEGCVHKLEGEFVFAIWNKVSRRLFIATDPLGFRPVFYYDGLDEFIFCSEIKGIVSAKTTPNYFNEEHLIEYHFRQSDPAQTYNKEIFSVTGGTTLVLENDNLSIKKYWALETKRKYSFTTDDEWFACMRHLMFRAVEKRLNPEMPVGVTLSGGLDSSSVACILSELLAKKNKPLYSFSSVLPLGHGGTELDERRYIDIVNKHCPNIIQTFVEAPGLGPFDNVEEAFERDEAIPNSFFYMDQAILKAVRAKGVRGLFTGFGGDFFVSWGSRYAIYLLVQQGKYEKAFQLLKQLSNNDGNGLLKQFKSDYLVYTCLWRALRKMKPGKRDWSHKPALKIDFIRKYKHLQNVDTNPDQWIEMKKALENGRIGRYNSKFVNREAYYDIATNTPFFDKELIEFLMDVPLSLFTKNGQRRNLIRKVMSGILPVEIQFRKDKLPYSPDFGHRTLDGKDKLHEIINSTQNNFLFDKYFSKQLIMNHFDNIKLYGGGGAISKSGIHITQAGIACKILAQLKDLNYHFD